MGSGSGALSSLALINRIPSESKVFAQFLRSRCWGRRLENVETNDPAVKVLNYCTNQPRLKTVELHAHRDVAFGNLGIRCACASTLLPQMHWTGSLKQSGTQRKSCKSTKLSLASCPRSSQARKCKVLVSPQLYHGKLVTVAKNPFVSNLTCLTCLNHASISKLDQS